ncbi:RloB family protein [Anaerolineales bacterium HSG6]|nr:RloB family protein [Anaerolineales bacterium HSG6]
MLKPRAKGFKKPVSILIICEDTLSAVYYLKAKIKACGLYSTTTIKKLKTDDIAVDVEGSRGGSAPISVVKYAIRERDNYNRRAKKERSYPYQEVYCVMDVDEHESLSRAIARIHTENRNTTNSELIHIISNECFELWYLLHFMNYSAKPLHRPFDKYLSPYLGQAYDKGNRDIYGNLTKNQGNEKQAIHLAQNLEQEHLQSCQHPPEKLYLCNPSTEVYKLINRLNQISRQHEVRNPNKIEDLAWEDIEATQSIVMKSSPFIEKLLHLLNMFYPYETKAYKIDLLIDMVDNPHNTACNEHKKIADYYYQHYFQWKNN